MGKTAKKLIFVSIVIVLAAVMILTPAETPRESDEVVTNDEPLTIKQTSFEENEEGQEKEEYSDKIENEVDNESHEPSEDDNELYENLPDSIFISHKEPNYEVGELLYNPTDFESMVKIVYHPKYNINKEIDLTYSIENKSFVDTSLFDIFEKAHNYVSDSFPEFMSMQDRYLMNTSVIGDEIKVRFKLSSSKIVLFSEIKDREEEFRATTIKEAEKLINDGVIDGEMSQYETAKAIHEWVVDRVSYDYTYNDLYYDAYSALVNGKTVCQGYAGLFNRMLSLYGIDAKGVSGVVRGEGHIWTEAMLDGELYYIDPTWNDTGRTMEYFTTDIGIFEEDREWYRELFTNHNVKELY